MVLDEKATRGEKKNAEPMNDYLAIRSMTERWCESDGHFADQLRLSRIAHLSFSQISTVEQCERRYWLQYILGMDPEPMPVYYTKGRLLHEMIAAYYKNGAGETGCNPAGLAYPGGREHEQHLLNALSLHRENRWENCEVLGIEKPFVMMIDPEMPPCVGVIDLILRKDGRTIIIDHKTGRDFYADDELQMAIYAAYLREAAGDGEYEFYYEHYRWVNHLDRIRKPAFKRVQVVLEEKAWERSLGRIWRGSRVIGELRAGRRPGRTGECFRCPYRGQC